MMAVVDLAVDLGRGVAKPSLSRALKTIRMLRRTMRATPSIEETPLPRSVPVVLSSLH
jgi:hypothetical protein